MPNSLVDGIICQVHDGVLEVIYLGHQCEVGPTHHPVLNLVVQYDPSSIVQGWSPTDNNGGEVQYSSDQV